MKILAVFFFFVVAAAVPSSRGGQSNVHPGKIAGTDEDPNEFDSIKGSLKLIDVYGAHMRLNYTFKPETALRVIISEMACGKEFVLYDSSKGWQPDGHERPDDCPDHHHHPWDCIGEDCDGDCPCCNPSGQGENCEDCQDCLQCPDCPGCHGCPGCPGCPDCPGKIDNEGDHKKKPTTTTTTTTTTKKPAAIVKPTTTTTTPKPKPKRRSSKLGRRFGPRRSADK